MFRAHTHFHLKLLRLQWQLRHCGWRVLMHIVRGSLHIALFWTLLNVCPVWGSGGVIMLAQKSFMSLPWTDFCMWQHWLRRYCKLAWSSLKSVFRSGHTMHHVPCEEDFTSGLCLVQIFSDDVGMHRRIVKLQRHPWRLCSVPMEWICKVPNTVYQSRWSITSYLGSRARATRSAFLKLQHSCRERFALMREMHRKPARQRTNEEENIYWSIRFRSRQLAESWCMMRKLDVLHSSGWQVSPTIIVYSRTACRRGGSAQLCREAGLCLCCSNPVWHQTTLCIWTVKPCVAFSD